MVEEMRARTAQQFVVLGMLIIMDSAGVAAIFLGHLRLG